MRKVSWRTLFVSNQVNIVYNSETRNTACLSLSDTMNHSLILMRAPLSGSVDILHSPVTIAET